MIDDVCTCGCKVFTTKPVGPHMGLYCNYCGKWLKWAKKPCRPCINTAPDYPCGPGCGAEHLVSDTVDSDEVDEVDEDLPW